MAKKEVDNILSNSFRFVGKWEDLLKDKKFVNVFLSDVLEDYIIKRRWYGGKASKLKYIELAEYFKIQQHGEVYYGLLLEVNFEEAFFHHYFLPIAFVSDESYASEDRILPININGVEGFIIDAINLEAFRKLVFERILNALPKDKTKVQYHKSTLLNAEIAAGKRDSGLDETEVTALLQKEVKSRKESVTL